MISEMHEVTPDFLQLLISGGETIDVEFKGEEYVALSDHQLIGALVCLANRLSSKSGWLLIGVEDDGRITGARPRHNTITELISISFQRLLPLGLALRFHRIFRYAKSIIKISLP